MEYLALKIRLAILWLFVAVTMSVNTTLYLIVPGVIDEIRAGEVVGMQAGPGLLLVRRLCIIGFRWLWLSCPSL